MEKTFKLTKKQNEGEKGVNRALPSAPVLSAEKQKDQAWDLLGKLINELHEFVQPRSNVHKEIKTKVASIGSTFKKLKALEDVRVTQLEVSTPDTVSTLSFTRVRAVTETPAVDTAADADCESVTGENREIRKAKRKQRPESPEASSKKKKRKEVEPTPPAKEATQPPVTKETDWQIVLSKKEKKLQHNKPRIKYDRPNALIVRPKEKEKYSEILSRVKREVPEEQVRASVDKIRRTATGDLLIILSKENTDKGHGLQKTINAIVGEDAKVINKGPQEDLEIKDLDDMTTKQEVLAALQKAVGEADEVPLDAVKSLRKSYGGTQTAVVTLATSLVAKVLGEEGKIRIGWVNCEIRTVVRPTKCFRCWHYGHLATRCKSEVNRSNCCSRCGEEGHKAATCKKDARCTLCVERGKTKNCRHIAGSSRCPVFKEAHHHRKKS